MKGDFSRDTSTRARQMQFTRVLLQQGRPLSEADANEQSYIHHRYLRALISDLVGPAWRAGAASFQLITDPGNTANFTIGAGHYYVDGILCENTGCTYDSQPFAPVPEGNSKSLTEAGLVYLQCQERHLCAAQLPDLREVALGGPDTASRTEVQWQVRFATYEWILTEFQKLQTALGVQLKAATDPGATAAVQQLIDNLTKWTPLFQASVAGAADCSLAANVLGGLDYARPRMVAMAKTVAADTDACALPADSQYRGRENQLYRVEVHAPGLSGGASFKWSRENGSVLFAIRPGGLAQTNGILTAALESLGRDRRTGLCLGDWVELTCDGFEFAEVAQPLGRVTKITPDQQTVEVTLSAPPAGQPFPGYAGSTLLRRWDQSAGVDPAGAGTLAIVESNSDWTELERGVKVQFQPGGVYRTGDYWLIPARVASGDVIWPKDGNGNNLAQPPDGIDRHRAALGYAKLGNPWTFTLCGCVRNPLCPAP